MSYDISETNDFTSPTLAIFGERSLLTSTPEDEVVEPLTTDTKSLVSYIILSGIIIYGENIDIHMKSQKSRGQTTVIGVTVMLAVFVVLLSVYEVSIFPSIAGQREFEQQQEVRETAPEIQSKISIVAATGVPQSVSVDSSVDYPPRLLPIPEPTVSVSSSDNAYPIYLSGTQDNTTADDTDFSENTRFIQISSNYYFSGDSQGIIHQPGLTVTGDTSPDSLANSSQAPITTQQVITGNRITLPIVSNGISKSGTEAQSIQMSKKESIYTSREIDNKNGEFVSVTLPTVTSEEVWREELQSETVDNGGRIREIRYSQSDPIGSGSSEVNYVTVELKRGTSYQVTAYEVEVE